MGGKSGGPKSWCPGRGAGQPGTSPQRSAASRQATCKSPRKPGADWVEHLNGALVFAGGFWRMKCTCSGCSHQAFPAIWEGKSSPDHSLHSLLPAREVSLPECGLQGASLPGAHQRRTLPSWGFTLLRPLSERGLDCSQDGPGLRVGCETTLKGFLIGFPDEGEGVQVAHSNCWGRAPSPSTYWYCRLR